MSKPVENSMMEESRDNTDDSFSSCPESASFAETDNMKKLENNNNTRKTAGDENSNVNCSSETSDEDYVPGSNIDAQDDDSCSSNGSSDSSGTRSSNSSYYDTSSYNCTTSNSDESNYDVSVCTSSADSQNCLQLPTLFEGLNVDDDSVDVTSSDDEDYEPALGIDDDSDELSSDSSSCSCSGSSDTSDCSSDNDSSCISNGLIDNSGGAIGTSLSESHGSYSSDENNSSF